MDILSAIPVIRSRHFASSSLMEQSGLIASAVESNSAVATPLPPAVILFGAGLVALIGLGARNWQQA